MSCYSLQGGKICLHMGVARLLPVLLMQHDTGMKNNRQAEALHVQRLNTTSLE
jgi:hypothetical protein